MDLSNLMLDVNQVVNVTIPVISVVATYFVFIYREMRRVEMRLESNLKSQLEQINIERSRSDKFFADINARANDTHTRIDEQNKRSDRLYEMFYELVKEKK